MFGMGNNMMQTANYGMMSFGGAIGAMRSIGGANDRSRSIGESRESYPPFFGILIVCLQK